MKTQWQTSFVAILLATFLFGSNAIGLHSLTHNDSDHNTDCEYCTFLVQKEIHDAITFEVNTSDFNSFTGYFTIVPIDYTLVSIKDVSLSTCFTRPPPFYN